MTFSLIGRCPASGQLGIAISSSSIAVGARCPWLRAGVGAVATQNVTLPALGPAVLDLLGSGEHTPDTALRHALDTHPASAYRQVSVIDAKGRTALFSGSQSLGLHHARAGTDCVAAGNLLASVDVIHAMVSTFEKTPGTLPARLIATMRAAMAAGGEAGPVHSAALKVVGDVSWPIVDLRVDWADADPIAALERLWQAYEPQMQDYLVRAIDPTAAPRYGVPGDE